MRSAWAARFAVRLLAPDSTFPPDIFVPNTAPKPHGKLLHTLEPAHVRAHFTHDFHRSRHFDAVNWRQINPTHSD